MVEPIVLPRSEHSISRRDIDPDALKVLYRLHQFGHVACLVGGSVRDLLLGRRPKDFDVGTSAHPYEIKRLFRNCWIIGRRFRLAHVKFGTKVIEVATFRRQVPAGTEEEPPRENLIVQGTLDDGPESIYPGRERLFHRDNTFGTPEEDAFRRDFTINALFYEVATFSVIDYVGGLRDLAERVLRSIGDPDDRFVEDPVRMLRAHALAARLDFAIDAPVHAAIARHRRELGRASAARLLEEYYKILRAGSAENAFHALAEARLLDAVTPELQRHASDDLWRSLGALDAYRRCFDATPETLTNAILLGSLLVPVGFSAHRRMGGEAGDGSAAAKLGILPIPRRDLEHLRQVLSLQRRLLDINASPRAIRGLLHRTAFRDALTWLEIYGNAPDVSRHWRTAMEAARTVSPSDRQPRRRRRRRRHMGRNLTTLGSNE